MLNLLFVILLDLVMDYCVCSYDPFQRDAIIEIFYERHLGQLIDVITSSCSGASDSLAKPAASDSVKHSNTTPEILLNICELLCFCVLHHPYRMKLVSFHKLLLLLLLSCIIPLLGTVLQVLLSP